MPRHGGRGPFLAAWQAWHMIVGIGVEIADISPAVQARRMAPAVQARRMAPAVQARRMAPAVQARPMALPWADLLFAQREQKRPARGLA
jgi:hypothetical protein